MCIIKPRMRTQALFPFTEKIDTSVPKNHAIFTVICTLSADYLLICVEYE